MSLRSISVLGDRESNPKDIKFELIKQPTNYETSKVVSIVNRFTNKPVKGSTYSVYGVYPSELCMASFKKFTKGVMTLNDFKLIFSILSNDNKASSTGCETT